MLRAGLVGPEQRLQGDDDYVCVSLLIDWEIGGARRIAKIRFRDLSTKRSKNTRRVGPQRLDCCAKPSGHAPSPSFWGWVRHAHSVRMTVPGPNFISQMPGTDPSMVRLQPNDTQDCLASLLCCDAAVSKSGLGYPCLRNVVLAQAHSQREPFKQRCSWPGNPPSSSHRASKALPTLHSLRPRELTALGPRASLITSYSHSRARRGETSRITALL